MIRTGTLDNGFIFKIDDDIAKDMEFIDILAEAQEEDPLKISTAANMLLGKEQKKRLYDHIRVDGHVDIEDFMECFAEIMFKAGESTKN